MKHAIIRLREELRALEEMRDEIDGDPSAAGGLGDANRMLARVKLEAAEVREAISALRECMGFELAEVA